ncbi:MAG: D-glycerate dehydrogenase [Caldilineaceae bacterium]|nr:D-glycerate dehydrogenase [Caldilineaceae bacterium]
MSKPQVVVTRRIPHAGLELVQEQADIRLWDSDEPIPRATLLEWVQGIDGLYCLLTESIDDELLDAAGPTLKVVSTLSVGYDHIDVDACTRHHVAVGNTPGVLTDTTADLAIGLLLATARRIPESIDAVRRGEWTTWKPEWMAGYDVYGSTVGIVGLGRIGTAFAKRLQGFDCRILYYNPEPNPANADAVGAEYVEMDTLLAESDFISIHTALTEQTQHLFDAEAFRKMKPTAILINTSRGGTVDQEALYQALVNGEIAAAGLDVTTPEPLPADHPLLQLPNCVILPHIASASYATRARMALLAAENVIAGVKGEPLPYPI